MLKISRTLICSILAGAALMPSTAHGDPTLSVGGSLADARLSGISSPTAPTLFSGSLSATFGYLFSDHFLIGATTTYEWANQYSDPAPPVGNWRGSRWNIVAPTAAIVVDRFALQGDYELLGSYKLGAAASDGSSVAYDSPSGFSISLTFAIVPQFDIGLLYRQVSFTTQDSSSGGSTTLGTKFRYTEYGITATFAVFGAPGSSEGGR